MLVPFPQPAGSPSRREAPMKRRLVATAAAASLLVGSAAGAVIVVPGLAGAASHDTEVTAEAQDGRPDPTEKIREALQGLVDDDTINASQADAVASTLAESAPRGGPGGGHHREARPGRRVRSADPGRGRPAQGRSARARRGTGQRRTSRGWPGTRSGTR